MPWHQGVSDTLFEVECEGHRHTVVWSAGEVFLPDHPNIGAEKVLVALGGSKPRCLDVLDLWDFALSDGGFIEEWAPWHKADHQRRWWLKTALERLRSEGVQDFLYDLPRDKAVKMGEVVTTLPHDFLDRAMAAVVDAGNQRGWDFSPSMNRHLTDATKLRARRSLVQALANQRPSVPNPALIPFNCTVDLSGTPAVSGRLSGRESHVEISLHPRWLSHVWARGVSVHADRFTVDLTEHKGISTLHQVEWSKEGHELKPSLTQRQL
ncbi:MAG: hypothetical protein CL458_00525 [Acidimicrobiaceae bacterium]|nr:hypothetical protein [Acidimicrobiaceae bacterium]